MKTFILRIWIISYLIISFNVAMGQSFINGDFEKNTAGSIDQINLSNATFNTMMTGTYAFGTYGDMDIISTATYTGGPQKGAYFVAFTGGGTDIISMELTSELIKGKQYSISFWDKCGVGFVAQPFQIGVSDVKDAFGTTVYTCPNMPVAGVWTKRKFSFSAPITGKFITVQLAGGPNIGDWSQADNFSFGENENMITTGNIAQGPYCACNQIQVPFTATGSFDNGNVFTAQLSDKNGNFRNPVEIGSLTANVSAGIISCVIPCETETSAKYRIRVISTEPSIEGSDNGNDIIINAASQYAVSIKALPSENIKEGQLVTFRSEMEHHPKIISRQWKVNGIAVSNIESYSSSSMKDGDVVSLTVVVEDVCSGNQTVVSNNIEMSIIAPVVPAVSIEEVPAKGKGKGFSFKALAENEGEHPEYQWMVNGAKAGGNSVYFSSKNLKDGDKVFVMMVADGNGNRKVTSNIIEISIPKKEIAKDVSKEKDKKELKSHASGVLKHKSSFWGKKGRRFVKVRGMALRKMKKTGTVCLKE